MTSILFLIDTIYSNIFKCNYLRNEKYFLNFFLHFRNFDSILKYFLKKDDPHRSCIFELTTRKDVVWWMSKKSLFRGTWETWEATCNMGNGPKHCWNLNDSTFTIFIDHWERNSGWKNFSEWYGNSLDCLLANWLPMTGIVLLTKAIHCNMFRCNYLRNKNYFLNFFFFLQFLNLHLILKFFRKEMTVIPDVFLNWRPPKNVVR